MSYKVIQHHSYNLGAGVVNVYTTTAILMLMKTCFLHIYFLKSSIYDHVPYLIFPEIFPSYLNVCMCV